MSWEEDAPGLHEGHQLIGADQHASVGSLALEVGQLAALHERTQIADR